MRPPFLLLALLCAAGCGADPSSAASDVPLELGTGEASFEPMEMGDPLQLAAGTQGGHHVWLSMRAPLEPGLVTMELDVEPSPPAESAHSEVEILFTPVDGDSGLVEFVGWPARVLDPECAVDKPVHMAVVLTDGAGKQARAEIEIVATAPEAGISVSCSK